jgi:glycine/D-amino acid oxidase-like deaminating enzyme
MIHDVIVVGGGVTGTTIANQMARHGRSVLLFDDGRIGSGTLASGFLMRRSWSGGADFDKVLEVMAPFSSVEEFSFTIWPTRASVTVHRVVPKLRLDVTVVRERVSSIGGTGGDRWVAVSHDRVGTSKCESKFYQARTLVIATGSWANQLLEQDAMGIDLVTKVGCSFTWSSALVHGNFIRPWAPFKQVVAYTRRDGVTWAGDGSAILERNWGVPNVEACAARVCEQVGKPREHGTVTVGRRPVVKGKKWYCEELSPSLWVATGGGKIGTTAAALSAMKVEEATR